MMKSRQMAPFSASIFVMVFLLLGIGFASAQTPTRSVRGQVIDASGSPISGAIVYLTDSRTQSVVSYITQQDGHFRFEQLSPYDNYKLWAVVEGKKTATRVISSFDSRRVFHVLLKFSSEK